ncbi:MAG: glutamine amidotransferase family protein [Actinomycetia bacterium]|nr:glutamine amidotransferase family protein [Actinomycetes bacterium]
MQNIDRITKKELSTRYRIPSGCAVFGIMDESGHRFDGSKVLEGISMMHDRSNGLGGGFAAYGIYPQFDRDWAFHMMYEDVVALQQTEDLLFKNFEILHSEEIPVNKKIKVGQPPLVYRYFLKVNPEYSHMEEDYIVKLVMDINSSIRGAYVMSSGKNMGIFKGVGYPEEIGRFFKIEDYQGHIWTSHGRFPTNSVGWWGGAHPFGLLNWSVVHNGEISSYGSNQRFVSDFGYRCSLSTDTEVITYLFDLLVRKEKIDINLIHLILSAPLWEEIDRLPARQGDVARTLRILYGGCLLNGPFNIIVGHNDFMYALNDRIKLRPMVAARKGNFLIVASEEAAIRKVCPVPDTVWHPEGGQPVIGVVKSKKRPDVIKKVGV